MLTLCRGHAWACSGHCSARSCKYIVSFLTAESAAAYSVCGGVPLSSGEGAMVMRETTTENQLEQLASLFRLLSDRTRLNLLMLLADGERNVTSLCETLRLPQPTVSHHLGLLRMSNVIANRRDGKQVFYSLDGRVNLDDQGAIDIVTADFQVPLSPPESAVPGALVAATAPAGGGAAQVH